MIKKKIFFPVMALAIIATAVATSTMVSAQDTTGPNSLVVAIAQKFNLNQSDVQEVFDEQRTKHQEEMKTQMEAKLTQAVSDGKITDAQKQAIISHFEEMKNDRPEPGEFKDLTTEERQAKIDERKTEMENWLSQNGLTQELLQSILGKGGRGFGHGGPMMGH